MGFIIRPRFLSVKFFCDYTYFCAPNYQIILTFSLFWFCLFADIQCAVHDASGLSRNLYSSSGLRVGDESLQIRVAAFSAIIKPGVSHFFIASGSFFTFSVKSRNKCRVPPLSG